jgi:hypothetical protein
VLLGLLLQQDVVEQFYVVRQLCCLSWFQDVCAMGVGAPSEWPTSVVGGSGASVCSGSLYARQASEHAGLLNNQHPGLPTTCVCTVSLCVCAPNMLCFGLAIVKRLMLKFGGKFFSCRRAQSTFA